jgi:hypothetical protein
MVRLYNQGWNTLKMANGYWQASLSGGASSFPYTLPSVMLFDFPKLVSMRLRARQAAQPSKFPILHSSFLRV